MARILYLVHRMPYPPNKGDKVRSYHLLQHLAARHQVHLGTFIDDPEDAAHLPVLQQLCASVLAEPLHPRRAKVASLAGLLTGDALTLHYYRSAAMRRWVAQTVRDQGIQAIVVFSSSMAQYAQPHPALPLLLDMVDVDSAKWADYAPRHRWALSWLYAREGRRLLACERAAVMKSRRSFFATDKETDLFRSLAPECAPRIEAMGNGVDTAYFSPDPARQSPFQPGEVPLVFTGAMDYWPNVDAVCWFAAEVLPALRRTRPALRLHVVGRAPTPAVLALAQDPANGVVVTGTVPDVRPWLQHAAVVVAPLRLARGIQNKILEAMAMQRPVVAATSCVEAMTANPGQDVLDASTPDEYRRSIELLLAAPDRAHAIGTAARQQVQAHYAWSAHLARVDRHLADLPARTGARPSAPLLHRTPAA